MVTSSNLQLCASNSPETAVLVKSRPISIALNFNPLYLFIYARKNKGPWLSANSIIAPTFFPPVLLLFARTRITWLTCPVSDRTQSATRREQNSLTIETSFRLYGEEILLEESIDTFLVTFERNDFEILSTVYLRYGRHLACLWIMYANL